MNKNGFTILELLISIALISVVLLLLLRVMMQLEVINHDTSYASDDEIARTELIQNIETDFLDLHLNGLTINRNGEETVITFMMDEEKELVVSSKEVIYDNEVYPLKSTNASYDLCLEYKYQNLENDYYLVMFTISVLIDGVNTTSNDDLTFTYLGLKNEFTSYPVSYACQMMQTKTIPIITCIILPFKKLLYFILVSSNIAFICV